MTTLDNQRQRLLDEFGVSADYIETLLTLVKQRLGIMSDVRDSYINPRIMAALYSFLKEKGISIDFDDTNHLMLIADCTAWQYSSIGSGEAMPMHLRARLNDLIIGRKIP